VDPSPWARRGPATYYQDPAYVLNPNSPSPGGAGVDTPWPIYLPLICRTFSVADKLPPERSIGYRHHPFSETEELAGQIARLYVDTPKVVSRYTEGCISFLPAA
jgi:hypothetical protein